MKLLELLTAFFLQLDALKQYSVDIPVALEEFGKEKFAEGYAAKAAESGDPITVPPIEQPAVADGEILNLKEKVAALEAQLATLKTENERLKTMVAVEIEDNKKDTSRLEESLKELAKETAPVVDVPAAPVAEEAPQDGGELPPEAGTPGPVAEEQV